MDTCLGERAQRVYILRERALEHLENQMGRTFEGLTVAARAAKTAGLVTGKCAKTAEQIDICYNALRHLTHQKMNKYLIEFGIPP